MKKTLFVGIDISKSNIDLCVRSGGVIVQELKLDNTTQVLKKFFEELLENHHADSILICCEYTGHYVYPLCLVCDDLGLSLCLENPSQIKNSLGFVRGKNDKVDARRIADYAIRFQDKLRLYSLSENNIATLKILLSERDLHLTHKSTYQSQLTDQKGFMSDADCANNSERLHELIKNLDNAIAIIDKQIEDLINDDDVLSNQHKKLCSIDGIGPKTAIVMIVETNGFKDFDNGRSFCCYAGVAPFEHRSGSSVRSRSRVSQKANKRIKSLLHMCAVSIATRKKDGEFREYYLRKIAEGKNKMSVLNAIRAKLVLRMFAVIRDDREYDRNYTVGFA
jgi:transposase